MIGVIFSLIIMVVGAILWCCIHLIFRFDITNSILVSGMVQILTREVQWSSTMRWCIFLAVLLVCLVLQNVSKLVRFLFGSFSIFVMGVFGYAWVDYSSKREQWTVTIICMVVGALLNYFCWVQKRAE